MPLYRPSDTVGARGLRSALISRRDTAKVTNRDFAFCSEKLKKLAS